MRGRVSFAPALMRRLFRHQRGTVCVNDFDGEFSIDLSLSDHMQRRIFWMGYYSREIVALLDHILRGGMTVVDVGANIGEISLASARRVGKNGCIHAFEPVSTIARILQSHIDRNSLEQITLHKIGLSSKPGRATIYESCGQDVHNEDHAGLGSIYGDALTQHALEEIEISTLDHFSEATALTHVDLIKIDIEGSELPCLVGARRTIDRFQPLLIIEVQQQSATKAGYSASDILKFLYDLGYSSYRIGAQGRLKPITIDTLSEYQNVLAAPLIWKSRLTHLIR